MPTLTHHNHNKFEIFAFAELKKEDRVSLEYKPHIDNWIRTDRMNDNQLVEKIRELEIDILVDLAGHTRNNRLTVFAQKPAPISLSWMGYGYTTGLSAIDYFLTDKVMAPKGSEHLFSEKPWHLKKIGCVWDPSKEKNIEKTIALPALSKGFITFGTLTRTIRINDRVIKAWADILTKVPNSKLIINSIYFSTTSFRNFHQKDPETIDGFKKKFKDHGISESRLDFYYKTPPWDSMQQIDIALDCFPHNSGTTLIEHLYMGNPFITYSNRPSVGRIGASILTTLGHPEWIATSEEEYVEKAVALASDPQKLSTIRQNLRAEMEASPIMDQKGFVRELEGAYQAMWKKWCSS
jgi:predicted O-linked N-acetylglucosamine transferase (SPINDLY family)